MIDRNIMELWLFDTCNFRCGYCGLVENGAVKNTDQLKPYRDPEYILKIIDFFRKNRPGQRNWTLLLTGGEPMMMPNIGLFVGLLGESGDKLGIYTNGSVPFKDVVAEDQLKHVEYVEFSYHPDWHLGKFNTEKFFSNIMWVRERGVPCLVRYVGAPAVLHLLPVLAEKCESLGVGFLPTTLFDPKYPRAYTAEQRSTLASYMSTYGSLLQLEGGVSMHGRTCKAASRIFAARLHQGGDITPCISTDAPRLGNILTGELRIIEGDKRCFKADQLCSCDVHFQQNIVNGVHDSYLFQKVLAGERVRAAESYDEWKASNGIHTSDSIWVGQGTIAYEKKGLLMR